LSALLYAVARPWSDRNAGDTRFHAGGTVHPDTGQEALALPTDTELYMHPEATTVGPVPAYLSDEITADEAAPLDVLMNKMKEWYDQSAADEIELAYLNQQGGYITAADFLPDTIVADARLPRRMWADGWFPGRVFEWEQPQGSFDSWPQGIKVTHNGKTWESNVDGNVWEPPTQWTEVNSII
jgi:hypothetical protein